MLTFIEAIDESILGSGLRAKLSLASELWPGDPRSAIDWFLEDGSVQKSPKTIEAMTFVKSLLVYFDDEEYVCGGLLALLGSYTIEGLASLLFPRNMLNQKLSTNFASFPINWMISTYLTIPKLEQVRVEFLDEYPLASMLLFVKAKKFPLAERLRGLVESALTGMTSLQHEIGSPELLAYVKKSYPDLQDAEYSTAIDFIKSLKILASLVEDPEDVVRLYTSHYQSLRSITSQSKNIFKAHLVMAGASIKNVLKIYDYAERLDCWNEQLWLHLMNSRRADSIMIDPYFEGISADTTSDKDFMGKAHNNLTDIFQLEDSACEECCSVTSLSAYFADLLNLISNTTPTGQASKDQEPPRTRNSLLNLLSQRRPDLRRLELTCANSQTLIPYISLVNEVLESFIRHKCLSGQDLVRAFNTSVDAPDNEHSPEPLNHPGNTDYEVYSRVIANQKFPFTCFPYDQARNMVLAYFSTFQIAHHDFVKLFQGQELLLARLTTTNTPKSTITSASLASGAKEVLQRQKSAEEIGLHQMEFAAITGETFFPQSFGDLVRGLSSDNVAIDTGMQYSEFSQLWGYEDEDDMLDMSTGLSNIKSSLMPRSGLEFQDILEIVKTQLFSHTLIITNKYGSNEFTESIADLRLLSNASSPPFQALTSNICRLLQAFLRLKARLGWSTRVLDSAIQCLRNREMENSPSFKSNTVSGVLPSISVYVVKGIASIVKLSELSEIEPRALIPLWGPIDSFGDQSLLHRRFLRPSLGPVFAIPKDGMYFQPGGETIKIQTCGTSICASLGWRYEYFEDLLQATNLSGADLNIETFSKLFRYVTICRILDVAPKYCVPFFNIFFQQGQDPLGNPKATLAAITSWTTLSSSGWTMESLLTILQPTSNQGSMLEGLQLARGILDGSKEQEKSLSSLLGGSIPTPENVVEFAGRAFDSTTAKLVVEFVEGSQIRTNDVRIYMIETVLLIQLSKSWPNKLTVTTSSKGAQFTLRGLLTTEEIQKINKDTGGLPLINSALQVLFKSSLLPKAIIESRFQSNPISLSNNILLQDWPPTQLGTAPWPSGTPAPPSQEDILIETESQIRARRYAFVDLVTPAILQDTLTTTILNVVKDLVPNVDISVISYLLTNTVKVRIGQSNEVESAMAALKNLSVPVKSVVDTGNLHAYFTPTTTDDFKLHYTGLPQSILGMSVNGVQLSFDSTSKTWEACRMIAGQSYLLSTGASPSQISWSTCRSMMSPFKDEELLPSVTVEQGKLVLSSIRRAVCISQTLRLTVAELEYINRVQATKDAILAANLNSPSLEELVRLQEYRNLRDGLMNTASTATDLPSLFSWLQNSGTPVDIKSISIKIALATGWTDTLIESALTTKYPNHTPAQLVEVLLLHDAFIALGAIVVFYDRLGSAADITSKPALPDLFYLARPLQQLNSGDEYMEAARSLVNKLTPLQRESADEKLTESQRTALVSYLLQQKFITEDLGIWDADGLFEYFLVDVQMGPQIRTSRIKQAISVVQFFVQRCLLGLEEGVSKQVLGQEKWGWLQQYTLWEVHRKLFLYPENWIDPALRDDKSQLFDHFESTLMQKDLSLNTFLQAVQTYVYELDGIGSLDITAYVHEPQPAAADIFHLFGRTRSAPYTFYYRTLTRLRTAEVFWRPWAKVEMDISSIETEWEGQRLVDTGSYLLPVMVKGRLYLFMPQISPKTSMKNMSSGLGGVATFDALRTQKPTLAEPLPVWEITMSWTEFVNETWSPKRVSSGSLTVGLEASSSQFRVDPTLQGNTLTLQVSHGEVEKTTSRIVGSFIFCNDQMTATNNSAPSNQNVSFPTYFQKAVQKGMELQSLPGGSNYTNLKPLLWVPAELESMGAVDFAWTLSKLPQRVTGLVVSAKVSKGRRSSFFQIPKLELLTATWTKETIKNNTELVTMDHTFSHELMEATADRVDPLRSLYNKIASLPPGAMRESFGAGSHEAWYHELGRPTAIYNWEIGLHTVLLAVDRFSVTQQYEAALEIAKLVFDPSADLELDSQNQVRYKSCWRFPPFQEMAQQIASRGEESFDPLNLDHLTKEIQLAIKERRSYGSLVHAAARGRPVSYMKWIVMKYADILIKMGDIHFRRRSLEALPLATQRYVEAARVLGRAPPKVPDLGKRKTRAMTFEQLREQDIMYDSVIFELGLPFSAKLKKGAAESGDRDPKKENTASFLRTNYFCAPLNPRFKQLQSLVHERLFNLRNSFDIQGKPVVYGLREPPIDPGALTSLSKGGASVSDILSMVGNERDSPLPRQRFDILLKKALALCNEVRKLSRNLVAAIEKKEWEIFNIDAAEHDTVIQQMMLEIKKVELQEGHQTVESLLINRSSMVAQLDYYLKLIGEPDTLVPKPNDEWIDIQQSIDQPTTDELRMSLYENSEMQKSLAAGKANVGACVTDGIALPLYVLPTATTMFSPLGVGGTISFGGSSIAEAIAAGSTLARGIATVLSDEAARADKKASLTMQLRERRLQANINGREIKSIDKEIQIARIHVTSIEKEIEMHKTEVKGAADLEIWYQTKYTGQELYSWKEKTLRDLYFQAYELAMTMALRAESSLNFEIGTKNSIIRKGGYWNPAKDGLLAAETLYLDLQRLENAQLDGSTADYNISKTISLKDFDPMALMKLRITGTTDFSVGELLYDMDFPGHYMRRIRSVRVSVLTATPLEVGCNTNAVLTLLEHKYRITQNAADYAVSQSASGSEAYRTDRIPISSIAVSTGSKDCGAFELDFSGQRYMPFENAGAVSTWRLEFPAPIRHFDFEKITDVQLHVQYTAYEGGPTLKKAARDAVFEAAKAVETTGKHQGYWALLDLKNDFGGKWTDFDSGLLSGTATSLDIGNLKDRLPFWSRHQKELQVTNFSLMSRSKKVMDRLSISVGSNFPEYSGTDGVAFGGLFTKAEAIEEKKLTWKVMAKTVDSATAASENVYLFVRYVYIGKEIW